jgi:hypothetical protein
MPEGKRYLKFLSKARYLPTALCSGLAKINVDAAVPKNYSRGLAATVSRDESRRFLGASTLYVSNKLNKLPDKILVRTVH